MAERTVRGAADAGEQDSSRGAATVRRPMLFIFSLGLNLTQQHQDQIPNSWVTAVEGFGCPSTMPRAAAHPSQSLNVKRAGTKQGAQSSRQHRARYDTKP